MVAGGAFLLFRLGGVQITSGTLVALVAAVVLLAVVLHKVLVSSLSEDLRVLGS